MYVLVAQLCLTVCNPMDCSPPGSSVHGTLQAKILEWVATSFSRGCSQPRDWTQVTFIASRFFTIWATRETHKSITNYNEKRPFMCKLMIEGQKKQYYSRIDLRTIMTVLLHFLLCINNFVNVFKDLKT